MNKNRIMILALIITLSTSFIILGIDLAYGQGQNQKFDPWEKVGKYKFDIEMELTQISTNDSSKDRNFKITDYQINLDGRYVDNIIQEDHAWSHRILLHQDSVELSRMGTLELKSKGLDKETTELLETGGILDIEKIEKTPSINQTAYYLKGFYVKIGDETFTDAVGTLIMSPYRNYLWIGGGYPE